MRAAPLLFAFGLIVAAPALGDSNASSSTAAVSDLSPAELDAKLKGGVAPVVIDVRTPEEYAAGHVPGAINISFQEVANEISGIDAPNGVALYCQVGPRARKGEAALVEKGYRGVIYHLEGGFTAWQSAGLPVSSKP